MTKGKYLVTSDGWFIAPDGKQYRAAWGDVEIIGDDFLGIKTNHGSSNWFAQIGSKENHIIIAGCQIHYAVKCETKPDCKDVETWEADAKNGAKFYDRPTMIYIAQ